MEYQSYEHQYFMLGSVAYKFIFILIMLAFITCCIKDSNLVDISSIDKSIVMDIKYASADNFLGKKIYANNQARLLKNVALSLANAQQEFKRHGLGLKVWDAYRPLSAQKLMWEVMPDERYVANPSNGGRHTRGTTVDVTLVDLTTGKELAMPSKFDDFTEQAHRNYIHLDSKVKANVELLESVMHKHGFIGLPTEWWHFDYHGWENYPVLVD